MGVDATNHPVDHGIQVIGIDAYGFDKPFTAMVQIHLETGDDSELWPTPFDGRDVEFCQIEKMENLGALLRRTGIPLVTAPIKISNGSSGWAWPLAFV